ncbi:MAG TPA: fumarate hydratase [Thermoplasmatales archaeon]|nr:fumarate hydratase [Thermoplasmatales archaeon]
MAQELVTPLSEEDVRELRAGDIIYLTGTMVTARDMAHKKAMEMNRNGEGVPVDFSEVAVYHCGPIMRKNGKWNVVVAGPTTSSRMEGLEHEFIKQLGARMIVGKGGMGDSTAKACMEHGAVYCAFTGGAAVLAAKAIKNVRDVFWMDELGKTEALWVFDVEKFGPLVVTIDTNGNNLTEDIKKKVEEKAKRIRF